MAREHDLKRQPPKLPLEPELLAKIDALITDAAGTDSPNSDLAREMIVTALKSVRSRIGRGNMKLLNRALRELRYAFKVLYQYRSRRKVTIFGSARSKAKDPVYRHAVAFAQRMRRRGFMVVTGAGGGVMQAGNEGAGREHSIGINIRLPFEQAPNPFVAGSHRYVECRYFFTRKLLLAKEADAAAFFPGGFGTFDEAAELLTLVQTGKAEMIPMVFVDVPGGRYWRDWLAFVRRNMLQKGRVSPEDIRLFKVTDSAEEAVEEILTFYRNYHSMRYVGRRLVLRVQRHPPPDELKRLEREFSSIIVRGGLTATHALPEEHDDEDGRHLPRIVFRFDRAHLGRLRMLIDRLNRY